MIRIGFMLILALILIGCATPSRVEMDYGNSFRMAVKNQTLNPGAEKNLAPVTGFDEQAAQITMEKYRKDFEKPAPAEKAFIMTPVQLGQ
jgi:PBP1b-binding outer membrane lipoprotein LpoB